MKEIAFRWTTVHNYMMMAAPEHHIGKTENLLLVQPDGTKIHAVVIRKTVNHLSKLEDFLMLAFFGVTAFEFEKRMLELYPEMNDDEDKQWVTFLLIKKATND